MAQLQIWNKDYAKDYVLKALYRTGHNEISVKPLSYLQETYGHKFITTDTGNYYLLFKKEWQKSFNNLFSHYIKKENVLTGLGESINIEYLKFCINKQCTLLYAHKDYPGVIYTIDREKLLKLINIVLPETDFKHTPTVALLKIWCDHENLKRTQDKTNTHITSDYSQNPVQINEQTYSFPIKLLKRFLI